MSKIFCCNGVNSDEIHLKTLYHPAVCYCLAHRQFCPVQSSVTVTSPGLSSPANSFQLSVTVLHISRFVQSSVSVTSPGLPSPVNSFQLSVIVSHISIFVHSSVLLSHSSSSLYAAPFCFSPVHSPLCFSLVVIGHTPLKLSHINNISFLPSASASFSASSFTGKIEAVIPL